MLCIQIRIISEPLRGRVHGNRHDSGIELIPKGVSTFSCSDCRMTVKNPAVLSSPGTGFPFHHHRITGIRPVLICPSGIINYNRNTAHEPEPDLEKQRELVLLLFRDKEGRPSTSFPVSRPPPRGC